MLLQTEEEILVQLYTIKEEIAWRYENIFIHGSNEDIDNKSFLNKLYQTATFKEHCYFAAQVFHTIGMVDPKRFGILSTKRFWHFIYCADIPELLNVRKRYLLSMQKILKTYPVLNPYYARLYDKLAIINGRKQRYGTQQVPNYEKSIFNYKEVNARRLAMKLPPIKK